MIYSSCGKQQLNMDIPGWKLIWNDEFENHQLDSTNWTFDIGTGAPEFAEYGSSTLQFLPDDFPSDNFSIQWEGKINIEKGGKYTFYTIADDGVRLYVDGFLIIDEWRPQPATEFSGSIVLSPNKKYSIKVEYFEEGGGEAMILGWESDSFSKRLLTSDFLETNSGIPGLLGTYFTNKSLASTPNNALYKRVDKQLNWVSSGGWGNNELQYYTNDYDNVRLEEGKLIIEAHKKYHRGSKYTSSRIKTRRHWKYGRFEIMAKLPSGRGSWAAAWALPQDWEYGPWPHSGEIDIFEHVGFHEGEIISSVHNSINHGDLSKTNQQGSKFIPNACNEFHKYAIEWEKEEMRFYTDEQLVLRFKKNNQGPELWPFDKPFHFLFNIAIGGSWGGAQGIDDDIFPTKMEIEYFRVYQSV